MATVSPATPPTSTERDWTKPQAMAIPKEGYFNLRKERYGPIFPELRPATDLPSSRRSNLEERTRSVNMARPLRRRSKPISTVPSHA